MKLTWTLHKDIMELTCKLHKRHYETDMDAT